MTKLALTICSLLATANCVGTEADDGADDAVELTNAQGKADGDWALTPAQTDRGSRFIFRCNEPVFDRKCDLTIRLRDWTTEGLADKVKKIEALPLGSSVLYAQVELLDSAGKPVVFSDRTSRGVFLTLWDAERQVMHSYEEGSRPYTRLTGIPNGTYTLRFKPGWLGDVSMLFTAHWD